MKITLGFILLSILASAAYSAQTSRKPADSNPVNICGKIKYASASANATPGFGFSFLDAKASFGDAGDLSRAFQIKNGLEKGLGSKGLDPNFSTLTNMIVAAYTSNKTACITLDKDGLVDNVILEPAN